MVAYIFDTILAKGIRAGQVPARTQTARDWFREAASSTRATPTKLMSSEKTRMTSRTRLGSMYMFFYDPKHKKTLPYYDRFPLVFPFKTTSDGFYGINLHYLPLQLRAKLMDGLYDLARNDKFDESTRLQLSYDLLNGASKYKYFKPCIHQYLAGHVRSRFLAVSSAEWDIALFLPLERFEKSSKTAVWKDSRSKF
jgi:hypothetical protein